MPVTATTESHDYMRPDRDYLKSIDRASQAAGQFLEKSNITDMALMSYEDWRSFIETICKAYAYLEDDEIPF